MIGSVQLLPQEVAPAVPSSPPTTPPPGGNRPTFMRVFASIPASLKKTSILPRPRALRATWRLRSPTLVHPTGPAPGKTARRRGAGWSAKQSAAGATPRRDKSEYRISKFETNSKHESPMFKTAVPMFRSFEFRYCFVLRISDFEFPSHSAPPGFPPQSSSRGPASLSTINGATMGPCRGEPPATDTSIAAG